MTRKCSGGFFDGMRVETPMELALCASGGGAAVPLPPVFDRFPPDGEPAGRRPRIPGDRRPGSGAVSGDPGGQLAAKKAIADKAVEVGAEIGAPTSGVMKVPDGYLRRFEFGDVYYTEAHGAHYVKGEIRAKYEALLGARGPLGLPITDEQDTAPNTKGKFNHFSKNASIYWSGNTGPMVVQGAIRDFWARHGSERGPLGFPIADEQRIPGFGPADDPRIAWSLFENGAILSDAGVAAQALAVTASADELKMALRRMLDERVKNAKPEAGLEARVDLSIGNIEYGFFQCSPRVLTFRFYGFLSMPLIPDPTFEIELPLRFMLAWTPGFAYPKAKTLVAKLEPFTVTASGVAHDEIREQLYDNIKAAFWHHNQPPEAPWAPDGSLFIAEVPTGADQHGAGALDVIDIVPTREGGLQVLLNPLPPFRGERRQHFAQGLLEQALGFT